MTKKITKDDKIFIMYRQYKGLLDKINTLEKNGLSQIAAHLTVAHMLDYVTCVIKKEREISAVPIVVTNATTTSSTSGDVITKLKDQSFLS